MKYRKYLFLVLAIVLFAAAYLSEQRVINNSLDFNGLVTEAGEQLKILETESNEFADALIEKTTGRESAEGLDALFSSGKPDVEWISYFVYENDSLIWWSDNKVLPGTLRYGNRFVFLQNGWYEVFERDKGKFSVKVLLKVRNQYPFQNRFLSNDFHPCLKLPESTLLFNEPHQGALEVNSSNGKPLFYVKPGSEPVVLSSPFIAFLYILAYVLFLLSLYAIIKSLTSSELTAGLTTFLTVVITRLLSVGYNFPGSLYGLSLFSPSYYASSLILNSLGDLLISALLITYLVGVFYQQVVNRLGEYFSSRKERPASAVITLIIFFTFLYSVFINYLLAGLIINSRISFNINNVFELDVYSLVGVIIIGVLLFSFYLVCDGGVRFIQKTGTTLKQVLLVYFLTQVVFIITLLLFRNHYLVSDYGISAFLLTNFLMLYSGYIRRNMRKIFAFTRYLLIIFGFSIYAAQTISDFNRLREKENRKLLAGKLENEQDQVAEYLFDDIAEKVKRDKVINDFFASSYEKLLTSYASEDVIARRMTQLYFTGYWGKYDITIKCFNADGLPVNTGGDPTWNLDYFNIIIREDGRTTLSPYLYFSGNASGRISYIGKIPVFDPVDENLQTGTILINLTSKALHDEGGFPELLISDKISQKRDISSYSYAHYRDNLLVNHFGNFNYLTNSESYDRFIDSGLKEQFVKFDGSSHLFYRTGSNGLLIITVHNPGILEFITLFSYLFSFYGFSFIIIYGLHLFVRNKGRIAINFKNRIQVTVIVIVVTTMLLIGGATVYYIFSNYITNLSVNVNDRLKSMLISLQDELSKRSLNESEISDEMNYTFSKLANTLSIDFNIYDKKGMLVYSTQPKIYELGIIGRTMNREAINNLDISKKSLHIQFEDIGKLKYLSAYEPVRNSNFNTVGFINLTYFAKQDELKKDISSFLVALINIYVLLFAFSIFITFVISNRITKPLQIIQERLGKIRLGKRNELIEWAHDDEIGALVREYNRMVEELSESADLLAKSERESAWREMAKQVAHEIKNPLTPMKLSVQHLQRAWKEKSPNLESIMGKFSQTLIEQIDTLSNIATEFSNFAKMPKANNETVNLSNILHHTVNLYGENESAALTYYEYRDGNYVVYGDKEQLMRVFSNLVKNAIQAIPEGKEGHVHVELKPDKNSVLVSVKDNGVGITSAEALKIFTPNFTTKTGGTGLGLAMVKNIVEMAGGKVWFQSDPGEGTTFFVLLPVYHESAT